MTFALMILLCSGHGASTECHYEHYHGMTFETMELCAIAADFIQRVKKPDVAPEMACKMERGV